MFISMSYDNYIYIDTHHAYIYTACKIKACHFCHGWGSDQSRRVCRTVSLAPLRLTWRLGCGIWIYHGWLVVDLPL